MKKRRRPYDHKHKQALNNTIYAVVLTSKKNACLYFKFVSDEDAMCKFGRDSNLVTVYYDNEYMPAENYII